MRIEDLERFQCQIRRYKDARAIRLGTDPYAVIIPFDNKEGCLQFARETNISVAGIDDEVPEAAPIGVIGEDTLKTLTKELARQLMDSKDDEYSKV